MFRNLPLVRRAPLLALAVLVACEAPTSPGVEFADAPEASVAAAKKTGIVPGNPTEPTTFEVAFNVKHGNDKNGKINLNGGGNSLTVSVLGDMRFNLSTVDMSSVTLADVDAQELPNTHVTLLNRKYQASIVDLNGDGILDLLLHFSVPEMQANGDISAATTALCLYGEGPNFTINGCAGTGDGGGGSGGGGGADKPVTTDVVGWGGAVVRAINNAWLAPDPETQAPGWRTAAMEDLVGSIGGSTWMTRQMPLGSILPAGSAPADFFDICGLSPNPDYAWVTKDLLVRTEITLPAGATNVQIEFIVDDQARFWVNGVEVTNGFRASGRDTSTGQSCVTYARSVTVRVPDSALSSDGVNKLAVWAQDVGVYANFLDFRVIADVPQS